MPIFSVHIPGYHMVRKDIGEDRVRSKTQPIALPANSNRALSR